MSEASSKVCYKVEKKCTNCEYNGPHEIEKGTLVKDAICSNCGCKSLPSDTTSGGNTIYRQIGIGIGKPNPIIPNQPYWANTSPNQVNVC
jgi:hypothetical protein